MKLLPSRYRPWSMQRRFHASRAPIRCVVAGRQAGKTHAAAEEVLRIICQRPGSVSCLLMPNYKATKGTLRHLRRALRALGAARWRWVEVDKVFHFWNGAELYVRTADDKEGVPTRGLTIDGVLWGDEAAYIPREAWEAARLTQAAVQDPKVIVTTTACGKNWVYEEFNAGLAGANRSPLNESFRFRSQDSPYCNPEFVADMRAKLGPRRSLQELDAQFLGDADAAFKEEDIAALFAGGIAEQRGEQLSLGVDLGKEQDFTVLTLMNEFGEARILGRWRRMDWKDQRARIIELALRHRALVVLDLGAGGGYGGMMKDWLEDDLGVTILTVKTANLGIRAQLIETLIADMEIRRLSVDPGEAGPALRHELKFFEAHRQIVGGIERWRYHGPVGAAPKKGQDEADEDHDDCVISLALANWGRVHGWEAAAETVPKAQPPEGPSWWDGRRGRGSWV